MRVPLTHCSATWLPTVALLATLLALVILVLLPHVASAPPPQADAEPDTKPREP
jgi:hypothetical protein